MTSAPARPLAVLLALLLALPAVQAVEAGDALALLVGGVLCVTGVCACLGVYARKRHGEV